MAEIGTLEYTITAKDETSNTIDAIARKIQEMNNGLNEAGQLTDEQMARIAKDIQDAYAGLDQASATHRASLDSLQQTYDSLGTAMGEAFREGTQQGDAAYRMANQQRNAVAAQIREEKKLGKEIDKTADELGKIADAFETKAKKVKETTTAEASMRRQMMLIVQQMAEQEEAARAAGGETAVQALRASKGFQDLQAEAGRLSNAIGDAKKQMTVFANDNAGLQGVIVGLQGMSGAMSAAQGIAGMFTTDQEKLQQVMLKVQSVMAIANGMMAVSNALNKDSYFTLVILNRIKQAWASTSKEAVAIQKAETAATAKDTATETANTVATGANTAAENANAAANARGLKGWLATRLAIANDTKAKIANTLAAKAATVSSVGLSVAIRAVSAAIKAIPVIGWILAGISALVGIISALVSTSSEAEKQQEELNEKIKESAAEPVASLMKLSAQYTALGNNMAAKQKFIEENKAEFEKLGMSINSVADAEEALIKNKDKFVKAQIAKAAAGAAYELLKDKAKELVEAQQELEESNTKSNRRAVNEAESNMDMLIGTMENYEKKAKELMGRLAAETGSVSSETAKKTAEGAYESIASINRLSKQWTDLGNNLAKKKKFVTENKAEFDKLGISVNNVTDAENALIRNKDKFIEAMTAKAESMAYFDKAKESYKEYIEASMAAEEMLNGETGVLAAYNAGFTQEDIDKYNALIDKAEAARKKGEDYITRSNEAAKKAGTTTSRTTSSEDPFIKNLQARKKEYERYSKFVHSTNETLQAAAQGDEFKKLLEGGATYREYLENQIAELQAAGEKTAGYTAHLHALQDELATLEKNTVIDDFRKALEQQLAAAQTQQEMLDIIAQNRKKLEEGGDVEVNREKGDILDQQQKSIEEKEKERTNALLQQYSDYLQKKIQFEADYAENVRRIQAAIDKAEADGNEAALAAAQNAMMLLQRQKEQYVNGTATGDNDYDALLAEFRDFSEQKAAIEKEYDEKIAIAKAHQDQKLVDKLEKNRSNAISKLAAEKIKNSDAFTQLFNDLDELTYSAAQKLVEQIESQTTELHSELSESDLDEIKKKLADAMKEISAKNPFRALQNAIQKFSDEGSSANLQGVLTAGANLAENFKTISDCMRNIAEQTGNQELADAADLMDDIIGNFQAAEQGAEAWGGWWGAIIGGLTDLIPKLIKWINKGNENVKAINDTIKETEDKMKEYGEVYTKLQKEVAAATGQALDETNKRLGENIRLQIEQLRASIATMEAQMADTKDSKITDDMRQDLQDFKDQVADLEEDLANLMDDIVERTLGNKTVNSIMEELATALVDAWAKGENAAEAYKDKVKAIVKDIARNMIIQNLITDEFTRMLTQYTSQWTENTSWEDKMHDIELWYDAAMGYSDEMMAAFNGMSDKWKEWLSINDEATGLSGAIKGMSQQSADLLAGVANAIRLNQAAIIDTLSSILAQTTGIRTNTSLTNLLLVSIGTILHDSIVPAIRETRALGIIDNE